MLISPGRRTGVAILALLLPLLLCAGAAQARVVVAHATLLDIADDCRLLEWQSIEAMKGLASGTVRADDCLFLLRLNQQVAVSLAAECDAIRGPGARQWRRDLQAMLRLSVAHHASLVKAVTIKATRRSTKAYRKALASAVAIRDRWYGEMFRLEQEASPLRCTPGWKRFHPPAAGGPKLVGGPPVTRANASVTRRPLQVVGADGRVLWRAAMTQGVEVDPLSTFSVETGSWCQIDLAGALLSKQSLVVVTTVHHTARGGPGGPATVRWLAWNGLRLVCEHDAFLLEDPPRSGNLAWTSETRAGSSLRAQPGLVDFYRHYPARGLFLVRLRCLKNDSCAQVMVAWAPRGFRLVRWIERWHPHRL